ncbi:echinoderm microtubule-associated protein-like CG42247 isoform X1 [Anopheles gambiae]|uniref:Doublecortin domain-containing protein n=1 Tax=Anopheles gambiae TaxID=7165 RepID=A0A499FX04_ANOGA|nr:echinoderm microtubule-associated protein-like CG42247 isoform X1 [Anopheles gambiae]XP_061502810.1 echinoderm microtubule-associated protein-like CG42247 isoform X1 [Anopheles gambiae]XP_061502856.1 echinoderm microtubule-associated protein-like CG42247 isoform X1 [Anopheles gambiae]
MLYVYASDPSETTSASEYYDDEDDEEIGRVQQPDQVRRRRRVRTLPGVTVSGRPAYYGDEQDRTGPQADEEDGEAVISWSGVEGRIAGGRFLSRAVHTLLSAYSDEEEQEEQQEEQEEEREEEEEDDDQSSDHRSTDRYVGRGPYHASRAHAGRPPTYVPPRSPHFYRPRSPLGLPQGSSLACARYSVGPAPDRHPRHRDRSIFSPERAARGAATTNTNTVSSSSTAPRHRFLAMSAGDADAVRGEQPEPDSGTRTPPNPTTNGEPTADPNPTTTTTAPGEPHGSAGSSVTVPSTQQSQSQQSQQQQQQQQQQQSNLVNNNHSTEPGETPGQPKPVVGKGGAVLVRSKESVSPLPLKRPTKADTNNNAAAGSDSGQRSPAGAPAPATATQSTTNGAVGPTPPTNPNQPTRPLAGGLKGRKGGGWKARPADSESFGTAQLSSPTDAEDELVVGSSPLAGRRHPVHVNPVISRDKLASGGVSGGIGGGGGGGWGPRQRGGPVERGSRIQSPATGTGTALPPGAGTSMDVGGEGAAGTPVAAGNGPAAGGQQQQQQQPGTAASTPGAAGAAPAPAPVKRSQSRNDVLDLDSAPGPSGLLPSNPGVPGTIGGNPQSRYSNLSFWKARRVLFYRNGDPFFPGVEFRFKPGRDICTLEALLDKISARMDLPRGARYIFSMDGDRKYSLDELEDGSSYVVSSFKVFKPASYGKKNGVWYASPGNQGWGSGAGPARLGRKPSVTEVDNMPSGSLKPSAGRVIRIINSHDHSVQCRVLLNLRTSQPFEEVLEDLGQVLKMIGAKKMYTSNGQEVRSFSQLRNEFAEVETFYLSNTPSLPVGALGPGVIPPSPGRRSRSRLGGSVPDDLSKTTARQRARSKSRPRVLYAPENELVRASSDYPLLDAMKEEPTRITIRGLRRTFYPPLHHPPIDNAPPDKKLSLFWVHGYRGIDSKRNLWVLPSGELLYYVAAVAVLYDREEDAQRHYTGHTEDIMCMEVHPSRELVGSGQRAGRDRKSQAHVRIWSTESLQTLYVFGMGELDSGVIAVAFSQLNGGSYILAVDAGRESILSVWQWQWGHLLGKVATLQEGIWGATFHPLDDNLLITHGRGHLAFWHRRKDGFFEKTDIIKPPSRTFVTCVQFEPDGDVITADSDGFITIYSVDADGAYFVRMEFEAHNKAISCLVMLSEGTLISGGEKDRKIAAWDSLQNYKRITDIKLPESAGGVRSIYPQRPGRNDGNIYVGTTRNNILEGSLQRRFNQVIFGHGKHLWALAAHPDDEVFATGGHDKYVALWRRQKLIWTTSVGYEIIALAFHPYGAALAAGSSEGHLIVINAENGATMLTIRVCGSPLNAVEFNQVGDMIAIGSQNGSIYLFRVSRDGFSYKKINKIRGSQPLTHLDWSSEGNFLQSVTVDFDLLFWDVKSLSPEKSPIAMKDVKWMTSNCTVGFLVAGLWNNRYYPAPSNTIITTTARTAAQDLVAAGDADGYLRLFRYPCITPRAEFTEAKVYSGTLAAVKFLYGNHSLVTVGGTDASLMIWELTEE